MSDPMFHDPPAVGVHRDAFQRVTQTAVRYGDKGAFYVKAGHVNVAALRKTLRLVLGHERQLGFRSPCPSVCKLCRADASLYIVDNSVIYNDFDGFGQCVYEGCGSF